MMFLEIELKMTCTIRYGLKTSSRKKNSIHSTWNVRTMMLSHSLCSKYPSRKSWKSHWTKVKLARVLAGTIGSVCISLCHFIILWYCVVNFSYESSHGKEYFLKKHKWVFAKYIHIDSDWNRDRNWSYFGKNHYYSCLNQNLKRKKIGF